MEISTNITYTQLTKWNFINNFQFYDLAKLTILYKNLTRNGLHCIECLFPSEEGTTFRYRKIQSQEELILDFKRISSAIEIIASARQEEAIYLIDIMNHKGENLYTK